MSAVAACAFPGQVKTRAFFLKLFTFLFSLLLTYTHHFGKVLSLFRVSNTYNRPKRKNKTKLRYLNDRLEEATRFEILRMHVKVSPSYSDVSTTLLHDSSLTIFAYKLYLQVTPSHSILGLEIQVLSTHFFSFLFLCASKKKTSEFCELRKNWV